MDRSDCYRKHPDTPQDKYQRGQAKHRSVWQWTTSVGIRQAKRIAILGIGATVMIIGLLLLVLPGPGVLVMLIALAILGTEFAIARRWLQKLRRLSMESVDRFRPRDSSRPD